jgi:monoamine oxidase
VDVVVVGAGLAGLAAAERLLAAGVEPLVLEARDRVGGRTLTAPAADGTLIDHGAQWVGPTQRCVAALAERLGATTFPSFDQGLHTEHRDGTVRRYRGELLGEDSEVGPAVGAAFAELDAMAAAVPPEAPWTAELAGEWDSQTLESWIRARVAPAARPWVRLAAAATLAAEPGDLSLLHVLFVARSAGGIGPLVSTGGGAQERRFHEGAQTLALRLAGRLGDRVRLGAPVRLVRHGPGGVEVEAEVEAGGQAVAAGHAIVAVPPALAGRIAYRPALPGWRGQLTQRVPMGSAVKVHALYEEPFWRAQGLSGQAIADSGPIRVTYDNSPAGGSPGVLVGFVEGGPARAWARWSPAERREAALAGLACLFGEPARRPRELLEWSWTDEEWTGGCYAGYFPPGVWTAYGPALRAPVGRLHWAGTETATAWAGYMEGAVQSGDRAATEVLNALGVAATG